MLFRSDQSFTSVDGAVDDESYAFAIDDGNEYRGRRKTADQMIAIRELTDLAAVLKERNNQLNYREETVRRLERRLNAERQSIDTEVEQRVMDRFEQFKRKWERANSEEQTTMHARCRDLQAENKRLQQSSRELVTANRRLREQISQLRADVDSQRRTAEDLQHSLKTARDRNDRLKSIMTNRQAVAPLPPSVIAADFASIVTLKETADVYCQTPAAGVERILMELGRLAVDSAAAIQSTSSLPAAQLCQLIGDGLDLIIPHLATNGLDRDFFGSIHLQVATYLLSAPAQQQHSKEFMLARRALGERIYSRLLSFPSNNIGSSVNCAVPLFMLAVDCLKSAEPGMIVNLLRALLDRLQDSDSALLFLYHDGIYCTLPLLIEPFDDSFPNLARAVFAIVDQVSQWMERQVIERCRRMGETFSKICLRMFGVYDLAAEPVKAELCNQMRSLGRLCSRVPVDESLSAWLKGNGFWPAAGSSIETAADGDDLLCQDTCSSGILEQDGADDDELLLQDPTWLHENF